ncbi:unnamed protein product [[Actinomadura] parvosata subsp. kistnae]|uniref:Phosphodiester glycosidase domain-containing protein n=1 Tax=[Actinomadura] parvosata subsp. kistnae TaxID=1909395 RepID=A0A1V0AFJ2_9ACTN|nr:hypothetical protein [Nonomuraea sp. ATCC 55076]AQZ68978.1 hypothetical protein BKM31_52655 [Nonomuraea sp. ATCC 55076]SPL92465.1 unnamed protein product [Actinomadura parvosata subsp. kistnae]
MADQFDVIEAGERGRRRWIGLAVVLALLLIPVVGLLASRDPEPGPVSATRTPSPITSLTTIDNPPNMLTAPVKHKGGDEVIQVVFPHGARAEVRYPAGLRLAAMGVRPFRAGWIDGMFREFVAPYGGEAEITRGGRPLRNYAPNVTLWPRQAGSGQYGQVLLFAFGPWRVAMYDRGQGLTFDQRTALATNLKGRVTKDGYLVLTARGGVQLAEPGEYAQGEPIGPQLWFGGGAAETVALVPTPDCAKRARMPGVVQGRGRRAEMVCRGDVLVAASGPASFRTKAISGIRVTMK